MLTTKEKIVLDELISLYSSESTAFVEQSDNINGISGNELDLIFQSLHQKGYIKLKKYIDGSHSISLTYAGLSYEEQRTSTNTSATTIVNNFNAPITNSAVANSGPVTVSNGLSYSEIRDIISSKPNVSDADKAEALKVVEYIEHITSVDAPLPKSFLSRFSDTIAKHSWLPTLIGNALVRYFIG